MSRVAPVRRSPALRTTFACLAVGLLAAAAWAQLSVRPEDPLGVAIREKRVRVIHSDTPEVPGTSMHLQQSDPWLAYQRGRSYYFHEWGNADGAFNWLPTRPQSAATTSCGMCHNLPFPSVGSGGNAAAAMGVGKNAPHFFGGGLLETVAIQVRQQILAAYDRNRNGYIDYPKEARGRHAVVEAAPGVTVDFGSLEDEDGNGRPDLNSGLLVTLVDRKGRRSLLNQEGKAALLSDRNFVGYDLVVGPFASTAGDHQFSSLRTFSIGVLNNIMGILPDQAVISAAPRKGYWLKSWGKLTNAGAFQNDMFLTADPLAQEDPTRRGTVSEGELDLFEWYMANHPQPALGPQDERTRRGKTLLASMGCTACHVERWVVHPADPKTGMPGDRRFFDLEVAHNPATGRLEGKLRMLTRAVQGPNGETFQVPRREGVVVENVYTDLVHHDLGERFWDYNYRQGDIYATRWFKTTPLWGVGSSAPYGHDGLSPTLDDVIRRHGGEAEESAKAYAGAPAEDRAAVIAFLESLVLFQPETLPTDLDGDGVIAPVYKVAGAEMGPERFQPELLFKTSPRYRGWTAAPDGERFFSYELLNVAEAYGERLPALLDADGDTLPDLQEAKAAEAAAAAAATKSGAGRR